MNTEEDKELDDLLDTALEDFEKKLELKDEANSYTIEKTSIEIDEQDDLKETKLNQDELKLFEEIFSNEKTKQSMKQFKDVLTMFGDQTGNSGETKDLLENLQKVMSEMDTGNDEDDQEFEKDLQFLKNLAQSKETEQKSSIPTTLYEDDIDDEDRKPTSSLFNKVLNDLNKNSEKVLNSDSGDDIFSKLNFDGDNDDDMMMEPILSMLFSKDVLYPSLKLMLGNYEKYLNDNKDKLESKEIEKCQMQKDCIDQMCKVYENCQESDSKEDKANQLKKILDLLEKCGVFFILNLNFIY